jgi:hypothetical protein
LVIVVSFRLVALMKLLEVGALGYLLDIAGWDPDYFGRSLWYLDTVKGFV